MKARLLLEENDWDTLLEKDQGFGAVLGAISRNLADLQDHQESYVSIYDQPVLHLQAVQPTEEMIHKEKEEKNFSNGSLVEVSSDEDDSQGVHWL
ncbi:SPX domain-containing membrane protein At4g11810-like isoform X2 [Beta vulgaris subsp. vulgaris]|uniref:SPX domain-containing membrane protein At4g11810-like isoform X2 n=1 Tax=Beta vulgaris subsp. vulgaris TaxID=3555 RepID=UPI0020368943|nr:SPX domain-containing membrane protein At4g11810-like isoform X2 [Beta vulgaris subsp. vulgaris]